MKQKKLTKQEMINSCLQLVDKNQVLRPFDPKFNIHNTKNHEMAKSVLLYQLKKEGIEAYAEVIFNNGKRADILIPEKFKVIEILHSETEIEVLKKTEEYPYELDIEYYTTAEIFTSENILL